MRILPRIYHVEDLVSGRTIHLAPQASKHLISVLRLQVGDELLLFNGQGGQYSARLSAINKNRGSLQAWVEVQDYQAIDTESPINVHLVQAVLRAEKMDYALQKSVELGVKYITPLITERTAVKLNVESARNKMLHWQQIIISACEQCGRNHIPLLNPVIHFEALQAIQGAWKFLLMPQAEMKLADFQANYRNSNSILIVIGPEGGFSEKEIVLAKQADFAELRLGPRILRTETAGLAAVAAIQTLWGDF